MTAGLAAQPKKKRTRPGLWVSSNSNHDPPKLGGFRLQGLGSGFRVFGLRFWVLGFRFLCWIFCGFLGLSTPQNHAEPRARRKSRSKPYALKPSRTPTDPFKGALNGEPSTPVALAAVKHALSPHRFRAFVQRAMAHVTRRGARLWPNQLRVEGC